MFFDDNIALFDCKVPLVADLRHYLVPIQKAEQGMAIEYALASMIGWDRFKNGLIPIEFSAKFVHNFMTSNTKTIQHGLKVLKEHGICSEMCFSQQWERRHKLNRVMKRKAKKNRIHMFMRIKSLKSVKIALALFGPVIVQLPRYNDDNSFWIQRLHEKSKENHTVIIVGYDHHSFILRNSWGTNWAFNGYTTLPFSEWNVVTEAWCIGNQDTYEKLRKITRIENAQIGHKEKINIEFPAYKNGIFLHNEPSPMPFKHYPKNMLLVNPQIHENTYQIDSQLLPKLLSRKRKRVPIHKITFKNNRKYEEKHEVLHDIKLETEKIKQSKSKDIIDEYEIISEIDKRNCIVC